MEQTTLPALASHKPKSPSLIAEPSSPQCRETAGTEPLSRKDSKLLDAHLTLDNYKVKFLLLNELEKKAHEQALAR